MRLSRLQVEEGFLDGIDLTLADGLNVLIGPRGTGKTSVIELIRFCLDRPAYSSEVGREAGVRAAALLRSGRVVLTLTSDSGDHITVVRSADDAQPRVSPEVTIEKPIILSQNEIERLGVDAAGRLALLDDFRAPDADETGLAEISARIRSMTVELHGVSREILDLSDRVTELAPAEATLESALQRQVESHARLEGLSNQQEELTQLGGSLARGRVRRDALEAAEAVLGEWVSRASREGPPPLDEWPLDIGGADPLADLRSRVLATTDLYAELVTTATESQREVARLLQEEVSSLQQTEDRARTLRRELEAAGEGAGEASRLVAEAQESLGVRQAAEQLLAAKRSQLESLVVNRGTVLDELESVRNTIYQSRLAAARDLSSRLGPTIRVEIVRGGLTDAYVRVLKDALTGSGLHHGRLAPLIAESLPPRELVEITETGDAERLADILHLEESRSRKVIDYVAASDTAALLTLPLEDQVNLQLLDGGEYRSSDLLSTGQRCTVILPILLAHPRGCLIVDQPEDNLDNGFIVETVVEAIRLKKQTAQLLFATHNPNIPVLGEAEEVVLMGSDGVRGFTAERGPVDAGPIVEAITRIMEGGREAFERRAAFYRDHPNSEPD